VLADSEQQRALRKAAALLAAQLQEQVKHNEECKRAFEAMKRVGQHRRTLIEQLQAQLAAAQGGQPAPAAEQQRQQQQQQPSRAQHSEAPQAAQQLQEAQQEACRLGAALHELEQQAASQQAAAAEAASASAAHAQQLQAQQAAAAADAQRLGAQLQAHHAAASEAAASAQAQVQALQARCAELETTAGELSSHHQKGKEQFLKWAACWPTPPPQHCLLAWAACAACAACACPTPAHHPLALLLCCGLAVALPPLRRR
jgi:hypothetical protein